MPTKKKPAPKSGRPKIDNPSIERIAMRVTPDQRDMICRVLVKLTVQRGRSVSPKDVLIAGLELLAGQLGA